MAASAAAGRVENVDVCQEADKSFPMYYKELNCLDPIKYRKIDDFFLIRPEEGFGVVCDNSFKIYDELAKSLKM